jgi:hypothetical protein
MPLSCWPSRTRRASRPFEVEDTRNEEEEEVVFNVEFSKYL